MEHDPRTERRARWAAGLLVLAGFSWLWFTHDRPQDQHAFLPDSPPRAALDPAESLLGDGLDGVRENLRTPASPQWDPRVPHGAPGNQGGADRVAEILARLEELAGDPSTFHRRALPLIDELSRACEQRLASGAGPGRPTVHEELLDLVRAPGASILLRGAVFLALAAQISDADFTATFETWVRGDAQVPSELLRTAALAAMRRGTPVPCPARLSIARLADMPVSEGIAMPGIYPLVLDRIAPPGACAALRDWLETDNPMRQWFRPSSNPPPVDLDLSAAADYLATVEVLYCVWGHQSLVDSEIESAVLKDALMESADCPDATFERVRAAQFLVHSLGPCSSNFYDARTRAASSADLDVAGLASMMQRMAIGGIGSALVEQIEGLRYSTVGKDVTELVLILDDVGENLLKASLGELEHENALSYLEWLVADPGVDERARATALTAIVRSGNWEDVRRAAKAVLLRGGGETLEAVALMSLVEEGKKSPERRVEVAGMLHEIRESVSRGLRASVDQYAAELEQ